jgi:CheY-like chemotaxis protein
MKPRVVLVEDDASITRFVCMALEDLDIELLTCTTVQEARAALAAQTIALVITDLMLPGEPGLNLVQELGSEQKIPVAVLSAGLTPERCEELTALGAWRLLSKPVSVVALQGCVQDALQRSNTNLDTSPSTLTTTAPSAALLPEASNPQAQAIATAIATHFAGNAALFHAYKARCLPQFVRDIAAGDTALTQQDWPALQRLAHSLRTVLLTLGYNPASQTAKQLENAAQAHDSAASGALWQTLRTHLQNFSNTTTA